MSLYSAKVHMVPGGSILEVEDGGSIEIESSSGIVIESGGEINIEDGGHIQIQSSSGLVVESGGEINVEDGGKIVIEDGGSMVRPVVDYPDEAVHLPNFGISTIHTSSVAGAGKLYVLDAPVAGVVKTIVRTDSGTSQPSVFSSTVSIDFTSSNASNYLVFSSGDANPSGYVHMVGLSATRWMIIQKSGKVVVKAAQGTS